MSTGSKDGAFLADAKLAGGIDSNGREHPLNCDETGTLEVTGVVDVIPGSIFEITGEVEVKNDAGNPLPITGTVAVSNFPASQAVTGPLTDIQLRASPVAVSGTVTSTPAGTQDVNIVSSTALPVTDNGSSLTVDGTFFQATQPVSGTVAVSNFPATQNVAVTSSVEVEIKNDSGSPVPVTGSLSTSVTKYTRVDTYTVPASGVTIDCTASPAEFFAVQVKGTGAVVSAWDVRLEGSLNGTDFTQILQDTNVTGDGSIVFSGNLVSPCLYFRSRLASITLGLATNIVVTVLGI